jgi:hypothetical protein
MVVNDEMEDKVVPAIVTVYAPFSIVAGLAPTQPDFQKSGEEHPG